MSTMKGEEMSSATNYLNEQLILFQTKSIQNLLFIKYTSFMHFINIFYLTQPLTVADTPHTYNSSIISNFIQACFHKHFCSPKLSGSQHVV
jgi:hypothetical protein